MLKIHFSIFDLARDSMSGTIFFQLVAGVVFMSLNNFNLEAVRLYFENDTKSNVNDAG